MSVLRTTANTERGSQYYVNTMTVVSASGNTSDFYNEAGTGITIGDGDGLTVGLVLLRDMGKTVRLPVATGGGSFGIRTLRKVQRGQRWQRHSRRAKCRTHHTAGTQPPC